jgi:hypothetical protein
MPRSSRIKLITGLVFTIVGLLVAYVVTPAVAYFLIGGASRGGVNFASGDFVAGMADVQYAARVTSVLAIVGVGIALSSALYSFVVFALWFVGPPEKK